MVGNCNSVIFFFPLFIPIPGLFGKIIQDDLPHTQDDIVAVSALKTMAPPEGHTWATSLLKDRKL